MATLQPDHHDQGDNYPVNAWQASSGFGTLLAVGVAALAAVMLVAAVVRWIGGTA